MDLSRLLSFSYFFHTPLLIIQSILGYGKVEHSRRSYLHIRGHSIQDINRKNKYNYTVNKPLWSVFVVSIIKFISYAPHGINHGIYFHRYYYL